MEIGLNKVRDGLKRKGADISNGVEIHQIGDVRSIIIHMGEAKFKDKKYLSLDVKEKQDFEDLLYLSNVGYGNPVISYTL